MKTYVHQCVCQAFDQMTVACHTNFCLHQYFNLQVCIYLQDITIFGEKVSKTYGGPYGWKPCKAHLQGLIFFKYRTRAIKWHGLRAPSNGAVTVYKQAKLALKKDFLIISLNSVKLVMDRLKKRL